MSTNPIDALSTDQRALLTDITRKMLEKRLAEARELADLLASLDGQRSVCACPCGAAGHHRDR